jgi:endonuclease/exonuclease/phosphatase family metal-dependent hydrolase
MKIYSWNMLFKNRELDRAFSFIQETPWDIFCLQEVPEAFLARLQTLPVSVAAAPEADRAYGRERLTHYVVILSRYPILKSKLIPFPYHDPDQLPLGKFFTGIMFRLRLWAKALGNRHAIYADIETSRGLVRVFNIHLSLLTPAIRLAEFELAMTERESSQPTIVCGDFNILESLHITPLNLLLNGKISDVFSYLRERRQIEQRFSGHGFHNPLRGKSTHPLSRSQLDHILASNSFSVTEAEVLKDRIGSDHCPIRIEID